MEKPERNTDKKQEGYESYHFASLQEYRHGKTNVCDITTCTLQNDKDLCNNLHTI